VSQLEKVKQASLRLQELAEEIARGITEDQKQAEERRQVRFMLLSCVCDVRRCALSAVTRVCVAVVHCL